MSLAVGAKVLTRYYENGGIVQLFNTVHTPDWHPSMELHCGRQGVILKQCKQNDGTMTYEVKNDGLPGTWYWPESALILVDDHAVNQANAEKERAMFKVGESVRIKVLHDHDIKKLFYDSRLPESPCWVTAMGEELGLCGTVGEITYDQNGKKVVGVRVDTKPGNDGYYWAPDALEDGLRKLVADQFPGQDIAELIRKADEGIKEKGDTLRRFAQYNQVLYGRVHSFIRDYTNNTASGSFFVFYKAVNVPFKIREQDIYSPEEQILIRSMIVDMKKPTDDLPSTPLGGIIVVLDQDGFIQRVRESL